MFCVTVAGCALVEMLGSRIENSATRMAQAKPNVATSVRPEVAIAISKACRSLKVLIRHRLSHSTTEQHFTAEEPGSADESAGDCHDRKINRESALRRLIADQETPGRQSDN